MSGTQTKKPKNRSGWVMLCLVASTYALISVYDPSSAYTALLGSLGVLKLIVPILLAVLFLMALLNTFIDAKKISKHLGDESGLKGWIIALSSGVLSHGPGYMWFTMLSELRSHGIRDGLIVAFFYARAIKLPWLPMMISYFGVAFTLLLSFYIIAAALIQGLIADKLLKSRP